MEFNLRAISYAESTVAGERMDPSEFVGRVHEFRAGVTIPITLPDNLAAFNPLGSPDLVLPSLFKWARLYRYPGGAADILDVLGTAESSAGSLGFRIISMRQP